MASQPPIPRSMTAGDKEPQQPAQEGVRKSGRVKKNIPTYSNPETVHHPPREGDRGTPGPRNKSPARSWGEMSSSESTSSFSSRVVAMLREYEDASKALTQLKEELREARILNTRASNKERPATSQRFKAIRDEVVRLVLLREGIEKSAGSFLERFKNQRRFSEMKGLNTSGEPPAGVLSEEEEDDEEVTGVPGAGASEGQSRSSSGLPAGQRTPTAEAGVSGEEEEGGRRTVEGDPTAGVSSGPDAVFLRGGRSSGGEKKEEDQRSRTGGEVRRHGAARETQERSGPSTASDNRETSVCLLVDRAIR
ncbi:uncharacterized protein [Phyllobates terribilis]|uniref:uncharacterized protein isoform X2 n=1 Tax=Phyllobates terribilis TaxID=111132 RepID=UPI003CCAA5D5